MTEQHFWLVPSSPAKSLTIWLLVGMYTSPLSPKCWEKLRKCFGTAMICGGQFTVTNCDTSALLILVGKYHAAFPVRNHPTRVPLTVQITISHQPSCHGCMAYHKCFPEAHRQGRSHSCSLLLHPKTSLFSWTREAWNKTPVASSGTMTLQILTRSSNDNGFHVRKSSLNKTQSKRLTHVYWLVVLTILKNMKVSG